MTVDVATLRARLERNADLLTRATRERARAFAELAAARAEIREAREFRQVVESVQETVFAYACESVSAEEALREISVALAALPEEAAR